MRQRPPATRRHDRVADFGLVEKLSAAAGDRDHHQVADVPEPEIDTQIRGFNARMADRWRRVNCHRIAAVAGHA